MLYSRELYGTAIVNSCQKNLQSRHRCKLCKLYVISDAAVLTRPTTNPRLRVKSALLVAPTASRARLRVDGAGTHVGGPDRLPVH